MSFEWSNIAQINHEDADTVEKNPHRMMGVQDAQPTKTKLPTST
jgi:hypothetical protein